MIGGSLSFLLIQKRVTAEMSRAAEVNRILFCCRECEEFLCLIKHEFERALCQLRTAEIEKTGVMTCMTKALQERRITGKDIPVFEDRQVSVHSAQVSWPDQASHAEIGALTNPLAKNRPDPSEPGEWEERGSDESCLSGGSKGLLDDLSPVSYEKGTSTHGVNSLINWKPEGIRNGGMKILGLIGLGFDIAGGCIGLADHLAPLDAPSGHHYGECLGEVISSASSIDPRRAAKFGCEHNHGFVEQALS